MPTVRCLLLAALLPLAACGEKDGEDSQATDDSQVTDDSGDGGIDCATDAWADQTADTQGAWMAACVVPEMTTLFQGHDATEFANFGCATCHPGASEGSFGMPSQESLDWAGSDYWTAGYFNGDGTGLMERASGQMAAILGYEPFDQSTGEGFGCYGCHQQ